MYPRHAMREVGTIDELIAARREAFVLRPRYAYFYVDPELAGYLVWGHVIEEDAIEGVRMFRDVVETGPRALLADLGRMESLDDGAARVVAGSIVKRLERYGSFDLRQGVVHPSGIHGATVAGFLSVFPPGFPHRAFAAREDALEWLGREDALDAVNAIELAARAKTELPEDVRRLRELLGRDDASGWTLERAAQTLRVSKRTLQLRLEQAGTSFREELAAVRLARVKERLRRGEDKLLAIAIDVGFTSAQHFSRWFRSHTGMTPSEFRKGDEPGDD